MPIWIRLHPAQHRHGYEMNILKSFDAVFSTWDSDYAVLLSMHFLQKPKQWETYLVLFHRERSAIPVIYRHYALCSPGVSASGIRHKGQGKAFNTQGKDTAIPTTTFVLEAQSTNLYIFSSLLLPSR